MRVIVGLGNPGKNYAQTRHNIGFRVIENLQKQLGIEVIKAKHKSLVGDKTIDGEKIMLAMPMTFMNLSGEAVREIKDFYKLDLKDIIVVYDDTSLPVGSIRVRESGSHGGHNGMKSIINHLGTEEFARVRVGIGEKPADWDLADYVLSKFSDTEKEAVELSEKQAADCVRLILKKSLNEAMNRYNKRNKKEKAKKEEATKEEAKKEEVKGE